MEKRSKRPSLPEVEKFKRQFEQKYHRKMTEEEVRMFVLIEKLLLKPPEEERQ
jgi:hypothetical protein